MSRKTNRLVAGITLGTAVVILGCQLAAAAPFLEALGTAGATAFAVFMSWAIGREIDPACEWSAFVALPFTLIIALFFDGPGFVFLFFILLVSRVLNGSSGMRSTSIDSFLLIILGAILYYDGIFTALLILSPVFIFDAHLHPQNRKQNIFALISPFLFLVMLLIVPGISFTAETVDIYKLGSLLLLAAAFMVLSILSSDKPVYDDKNKMILLRQRISLARLVPVVLIITALVFEGPRAFVLLYPAGLAYYGTAFYHLGRMIKTGQFAGRKVN